MISVHDTSVSNTRKIGEDIVKPVCIHQYNCWSCGSVPFLLSYSKENDEMDKKSHPLSHELWTFQLF